MLSLNNDVQVAKLKPKHVQQEDFQHPLSIDLGWKNKGRTYMYICVQTGGSLGWHFSQVLTQNRFGHHLTRFGSLGRRHHIIFLLLTLEIKEDWVSVHLHQIAGCIDRILCLVIGVGKPKQNFYFPIYFPPNPSKRFWGCFLFASGHCWRGWWWCRRYFCLPFLQGWRGKNNSPQIPEKQQKAIYRIQVCPKHFLGTPFLLQHMDLIDAGPQMKMAHCYQFLSNMVPMNRKGADAMGMELVKAGMTQHFGMFFHKFGNQFLAGR